MLVGGREISDEVIDRIRSRVRTDPTLTRTGLSREVCAWLDGDVRNFVFVGCMLMMLILGGETYGEYKH